MILEHTHKVNTLAKRLYETYCIAVKWEAFNGNKLPTWDQLFADSSKDKISKAWIFVAESLIPYSITSEDTVYISGPMTGFKDWNHPAFHKAEAWLNEKVGCKVINPAKSFSGRTDLTRKEYMRNDIHLLLQATAVFHISGWESSRGAKFENAVAQELELKIEEQSYEG